MAISPEEIIESLRKQISDLDFPSELKEVGTTVSTGDGVAQVQGLENVEYNEVVEFESGARGIAINLEIFSTGVILLDSEDSVKQGDKVQRTRHFLQAPAGKSVLGRVVDSLGRPIDGKGPICPETYLNIEAPAPGIIARESVHEPLYTGIKAIDTLLPIGKGQRELLIGDRKTGKTAIAIDAIINQRETHLAKSQEPVYCIYVAVGQKCSNIAYIVKKLEEHDAMRYTTVVATTASDSSTLQFIAPYFGCALAEYFRDRGMHALIVYDDLTKHAVAYRQISLLLKRPPGREAYPGDIFFIHSRLLERAAKLSKKYGGGSMTALPIVETQTGDMSAYIPTNIISITDGQVFLESDLFKAGIRPAINLGLSVSRIGYSASVRAVRQVTTGLKLELARYREAQSFASFGSETNEDIKRILAYGSRLVESLKQDQYMPMSMVDQVVTLYAHVNGYASKIPIADIKDFENSLIEHMKSKHKELLASITRHQQVTTNDGEALKLVIERFSANFSSGDKQ